MTTEKNNEPFVVTDMALAARGTDKALLVQWPEGERVIERWIPLSVIDDDSEVYEVGHRGKLVVAGWFESKLDLDR